MSRDRWTLALVASVQLVLLGGCSDVVLTPLARCDDSQSGYATVGGATTGGLGGALVEVSTLADLQDAVSKDGPLRIRIKGTISLSDQVRVSSDKTIYGLEPQDGLLGGGLHLSKVENVIIRNLTIAKAVATDAISVSSSNHVWIDHCDLSSDLDHDNDYYDGLVDITHAADQVTVSWNRMHHHTRTCLVGHSANNASEDTGHLTVTFHHNVFANVVEGSPRVRFGTVHVLDNLYTDNSLYGIASQMSAIVLVEGNVFRRTPLDWTTHHEDPVDGFVIARDNDTGGGATEHTQAAVSWSPPYAYASDGAASVEALTSGCAGIGKIDLASLR